MPDGNQRIHVLHAFNRHRMRAGADNALDSTLKLLGDCEIRTSIFERDSLLLSRGFKGRVRAFFSGIYAREAIQSFKQSIDTLKPDVVHVHELYPYITPWILKDCKRAGVPVVMTVYDYRLTCPIATHFNGSEVCHKCLEKGSHWATIKNCRNNYAESLAFSLRHEVSRQFELFRNYVDHYIVVTKFCADFIERKLGISRENISLIPCAVDVPEHAVENPEQGEYVAFAGRFNYEKGVGVLIEACRRANVPLKLAGWETTHPAITADDDVECVICESRDELEQFYRRARMLVVPSIWYETFGLVAAEGSALGLPVIASRIGALQETVDHQKTGLHVNPNDAHDLSKAITELWNRPDLVRQYGNAGRLKIANEFTTERHKEGHLSVYQQLYEKRTANLEVRVPQSHAGTTNAPAEGA